MAGSMSLGSANRTTPETSIIAHQYDRVNLNTLWNVIRDDIPELRELIEPLLPDADEYSDDRS